MNRLRSLVLAGALVTAATALAPSPACAQVQPGVSAQQESTTPPRRQRRRSDVITAAELAESNTSNLYEAIERLRPQWLRPRGGTNFGGGGTALYVYQGNTQLGGAEALRSMGIDFAEEIRFLDSTQASNTLPGLSSRAVAGAIVIVRPGTRS
ncbi:MAG TPA: hypothetical protein VF142_22855 [Longimicrobium sp.]